MSLPLVIAAALALHLVGYWILSWAGRRNARWIRVEVDNEITVDGPKEPSEVCIECGLWREKGDVIFDGIACFAWHEPEASFFRNDRHAWVDRSEVAP